MGNKQLRRIESIFQRSNTVDVYENSHFVDEKTKNDIASWIIEKCVANNEKLSIFDAGCGSGHLLLIPLVKLLKGKNNNVQIYAVDHSDLMIKKLEQNLQNLGFKKNNKNQFIYKEITIKVLKGNLEDFEFYKQFGRNTKFDIILSILVLHHLKNWRLFLYKSLPLLRKGGYLVLWEWRGGIKLRDGCFLTEEDTDDDFTKTCNIDQAIVKFWKDFYKKRSEYHIWNTEISASNYSTVKEAIRHCFYVTIEERTFQWNHKPYTVKDIQEWVKKEAYSNFFRGLTDEERESLKNWSEEEMEKRNLPQRLHEECGANVVLIKLNEDLDLSKSQKIIFSIKNNFDTLFKLSKIKDSKNFNLSDFLTFLTLHDFFTRYTKFVTINQWDKIENTWDRNEKPMMIFEDDELCQNMLKYYVMIEKYKVSIYDIIYGKVLVGAAKPIVFIQFRENKNNETNIEISDKNYIFIENDHYIPKYLEINCYLSQNIREKVKKMVNGTVKNTDICRIVKTIKNKSKIPREGFLLFNYPEIEKEISKIAEKISNEEDLRQKISKIGNPKLRIKSEFQHFEEIKEDLSFLFLILYSLTQIEGWVIVPSEFFIKRQNKVEIETFGAILMGEKLEMGKKPESREELEISLRSRAEAMVPLVNLRFRHIAVTKYEEYSAYQRRKHALRSAVAAIMIRNFAHHHGSHVIPRLKKNTNGIEKYLQYINEKTALLNIINVYDPVCEGKVDLKHALEYLVSNEGVKLFRKFFAEANKRENVCVVVDFPKRNDEGLIVSPGYGEIGVHAIYIIFENYVRNVLKHCKPPPNVANAETGPTIKFSISKENTFAVVQIESDYVVDNSHKRVEKINGIIKNSEIIDEQGKTDFENPGIKEMRICANMLIGRTLGLPGGENLEAFVQDNGIGYKFKIPLAKYVSKGDKDTIERIKTGKEVKPDFLVVDLCDSSFILQNWSVLPQRICWTGQEENLKLDNSWGKWLDWIKRRSIFVEKTEYDNLKNEQEKYSFLLEKWWKKIFEGRSVIIKFCQKENNKWKDAWQMQYWKKIEQLINCKKGVGTTEFHFAHSEPCDHCNAVKLVFHHEPSYRIYRYFGSFTSPSLENADEVNKKIVGLEICSILAFKILIIDNELHDKFKKDLGKLKEINIFVVPEDKDNFNDLKDYDCVVFHLGMLDVKKDLYCIEPQKLPPYIRIVTGRARPLSDEILQECLWANSPQIDRSVFIKALSADGIFERKYQVFWGVLK